MNWISVKDQPAPHEKIILVYCYDKSWMEDDCNEHTPKQIYLGKIHNLYSGLDVPIRFYAVPDCHACFQCDIDKILYWMYSPDAPKSI